MGHDPVSDTPRAKQAAKATQNIGFIVVKPLSAEMLVATPVRNGIIVINR